MESSGIYLRIVSSYWWCYARVGMTNMAILMTKPSNGATVVRGVRASADMPQPMTQPHLRILEMPQEKTQHHCTTVDQP